MSAIPRNRLSEIVAAPLRRIGRRFPSLSRSLGRGAKLIWWTVTLQLPTREFSRWQ